MKQLLYSLLFLLPFVGLSQFEQKAQFGFFGTVDVPMRSEMPKMSPNLGIGAQFSYKPIIRMPLFLELKGNLGIYNLQGNEMTYIFSDGTTTVTDVSFTSKMHKIQFGTKMYYTSFEAPVRGYITPQIGYNFMRTRVRIADPEDEDDCQPLENILAHRSGGWTYGGETGIELDLKKIFTGQDAPQNRLYISGSFSSSFNKVGYVNVRYMEDHTHDMTATDEDHALVDAEGRPLNAEFINLTSNVTHEHKVAEIYNTYLRFVSINVGYVWYF